MSRFEAIQPRVRIAFGGVLLASGMVGLLLIGTGCNKTHHRFKHPSFVTEKDVVAYLQIALEGPLPDERREAVNHIAKTRYLRHQVVLEGLDTIARTDTSDQVRCSALLALHHSRDVFAAQTYLAIIAPEASERQARTGSPELRRDALAGTLALLLNGKWPSDWESALRQAAIDLLSGDRNRDIRVNSAQVLGYLPDEQVLKPLVDALDQRDFGVVYAAERSLMRLTGLTFEHDAIAWRDWLAQTQEPFAQAGRLNSQLDDREKNWWYRSMDSMKQNMATFRPKSKGS